MLKQLITTCDDLQTDAAIPIPVREKISILRTGLAQMGDAFMGLQAENQTLRAHREMLETQVMTLAETPEPEPQWWENIVYLADEFDDGEGDDWDSDPAA